MLVFFDSRRPLALSMFGRQKKGEVRACSTHFSICLFVCSPLSPFRPFSAAYQDFAVARFYGILAPAGEASSPPPSANESIFFSSLLSSSLSFCSVAKVCVSRRRRVVLVFPPSLSSSHNSKAFKSLERRHDSAARDFFYFVFLH